MNVRFGDFELDAAKVELRGPEGRIALEPQVFALLALLVANRDRLVSKDEIVDRVWGGRIVSDSAVSSRIKAIRRALGDDGRRQRFVRTIHGQGFRFVADATEVASPGVVADVTVAGSPADELHAPADAEPAERPGLARMSIAVLPFRLIGVGGPYATIAEALPAELISELARLRWLFVIARGSSFQFRSADTDVRQVGAALGARYCVSGVVEIAGRALTASVELTATEDGGVVWAERFSGALEEVHEIRARIIAQVTTMMDIQIPLHEARRARLGAPENLDAWSAYHVGLQRMYRFTKTDNEAATALFARAVALEPGFARAHAGLSFTHFQNVFLRHAGSIDEETDAARRCAERSVELDPLDPFANFNLGRAHWLAADLPASLSWLERSTTLSPSFAQGHYVRGVAQTLAGDAAAARENVDAAMALSPLDPMLYAMLSTRALTHLAGGDYEQGVAWAEKGARAPNAHALIAVIAAAAHMLKGDADAAGRWAGAARARNPSLTQADFFRSFPFRDDAFRQRLSDALAAAGLER